MEYGQPIDQTYNDTTKDYNFTKFVGYSNPGKNNKCYTDFFSQCTINQISKKVTELTVGVHPENKNIIVPDEWIIDVMNSVYENWSGGSLGSIHSRYTIPNYENENYTRAWVEQTINILISHIRNVYGMIENNQKLTKWTTVLGEFNEGGLRSHAPIKVLNKRPAPFQFNMRY